MRKRFKKKPVEIEAVQYTGDNVDEVRDFVGGASQVFQVDDARIGVDTLKGAIHANRGCWIIKGANGEFSLCESDRFAATYELVGALMVGR